MKRLEWYDPFVTLPRMKRVILQFLVSEDVLLGAPFFTSRLNFNCVLEIAIHTPIRDVWIFEKR
jgi:hypothetical protein